MIGGNTEPEPENIGRDKMPNITLYLNDVEYDKFKELSEQAQSEAREEAIKMIMKFISKQS